MVRKFLLYFEIALIGLLQVLGLLSAIIGLFPASAQATLPNVTAHASETARNDPAIMQDFMARLSASDLIKSHYKDAPPPNDQRLYSAQSGAVADHRFYTARKRGGKEMAKLIGAAEAKCLVIGMVKPFGRLFAKAASVSGCSICRHARVSLY
jgi:hypothetical protein